MSEKFQYKGQVSYQKIIKASDPTLVLFKLKLIDHPLNPTNLIGKEFTALIARKALTFMFEVIIGDYILIYGHFNAKNQFITEKYLIEKRMPRSYEKIIKQLPPHKNL
ncbi:hypothetical protein [Facklamia miroungae]|uniref:Single-strand binding protein family protein n=1 Tax=Facklamia miroungae TaxID=120956 RepID=A0A1G7TJ03_9LACT|nr:hypothetical protein [Facklamia miroungae]SDG34629.1 hypothetical protein SAMN05421791_10618 [Facklamia miroungae]